MIRHCTNVLYMSQMSSKKFLYNIAFSAQLITLTISSQTLPFKRISNPGNYYKKKYNYLCTTLQWAFCAFYNKNQNY